MSSGTRVPWLDSEIALLRDRWRVQGTNIPELLQRHSASTICKMAGNLGLKRKGRRFVQIDEQQLSLKEVASYFGLAKSTFSDLLRTSGLGDQELVDRLLLFRYETDIGAMLTASRYFYADEEYIAYDGKLWGINEWHDFFKPPWASATFRRIKHEHKWTTAQTYEYLVSSHQAKAFSYTEAEDSIILNNPTLTCSELSVLLPGRNRNAIHERGLKLGVNLRYGAEDCAALTRTVDDIADCSDAYVDTLGEHCVFVTCAKCGSRLILKQYIATRFEHGEVCTKFRNPITI